MEERIEAWRDRAERYFERRVRDPHAVDDLVQETCVRAWLIQREGRAERVTPAWLRGISWRMLARHRRSDARRRVRVATSDPTSKELDCPATSRERQVRIGEREFPISRVLAVLDDCIAVMPARWRGLIEERQRGAPLHDIAKRTGLRVNVIKLRLYRGRRALRAAILAALSQEENHGI